VSSEGPELHIPARARQARASRLPHRSARSPLFRGDMACWKHTCTIVLMGFRVNGDGRIRVRLPAPIDDYLAA
jgi:hypothetical protein